jgi:hypothetical protein
MGSDQIRIEGLKEFQRALRDMDKALPKQIRLILNDATALVIDTARPRMPSKTGRARGSLKARSSQREARVALGGTRAPYTPWLDFGGEGKVKGRPPARPFIKKGRYLYPALESRRDEITERMSEGLDQLGRDAGLEMS